MNLEALCGTSATFNVEYRSSARYNVELYSTTHALYSFGPKMGPPAFLSGMAGPGPLRNDPLSLGHIEPLGTRFPTPTPLRPPSITPVLRSLQETYPTPIVPKIPSIDSGSFAQLPGLRKLNHTGTVVPYGNLLDEGGDVHDKFKIDRYGNPYDGHTTINIPGFKKVKMPWE